LILLFLLKTKDSRLKTFPVNSLFQNTTKFRKTHLPIEIRKSKIYLNMYPKGNLFVPASHGQLEAILKEPEGEIRGAALVCHPHPLGGGTRRNRTRYASL
jgi:hypothetical protein